MPAVTHDSHDEITAPDPSVSILEFNVIAHTEYVLWISPSLRLGIILTTNHVSAVGIICARLNNPVTYWSGRVYKPCQRNNRPPTRNFTYHSRLRVLV